jgi:putative transcriptional regulator
MSEHESASFFERLKKGMEESISYSRGELSLKTTALPAPPPPASRANVIALRKKLKMSQSIFAAVLNVSTKLVQSWEQGVRTPDHGELRLIEILMKHPDLVSNLILSARPVPPSRKTPRNGRALSRRKATAA